MKSKITKPQAASSLPKVKAKINKLKLNKETLNDLSPKGAGAIKGGFSKATATWDTQNTCCWVAREVYGKDDPRWLMFRAWLLGDAPAWFRGLYLRQASASPAG